MSTPTIPSDADEFGRLAVDLGLLGEGQLREAGEIRSQLAALGVVPKEIPRICLEKGFLTREQIERVRSEMREREGWPAIPGYRIIRRLGRGGVGAVYQAHQESLDRTVAIKLLASRFEDDPAYIERFIGEAKTVGRLNDPNIVGGIDVGEVGGRHYFVMEYVEGETASRRLEREGPLPEAEVVSIGIQMAKALSHAAEVGLVHRDVKPHNILITPKGVAKLCDLGLAKMAGGPAADGGGGGRAVGTPYYISPEQAKGQDDADIRCDIYSLGATLFHLAAGTPPFDGPSPMVIMTKHLTQEPPRLRERNPRNSEGLERVILKMMAKGKAERHSSPDELLADLDRLDEASAAPARAASARRARPSGRIAGGSPARPSARRGRAAGRRARRGGERRSPALPIILIAGTILIVVGAIFAGQGSSGTAPAPAAEWSPEADLFFKEVMAENQGDPQEPVGVKVRRLERVIDSYPRSRAAQRAKEAITRLQAGR